MKNGTLFRTLTWMGIKHTLTASHWNLQLSLQTIFILPLLHELDETTGVFYALRLLLFFILIYLFIITIFFFFLLFRSLQ